MSAHSTRNIDGVGKMSKTGRIPPRANRVTNNMAKPFFFRLIARLRWPFVAVVAVLSVAPASAFDGDGEAPEIMLAKTWHEGVAVDDYWVSEKLDGVRARWDGRRLLSRNGKIFAAPEWFVAGFPTVAMDGELWTDRGQYENIYSIVSRDAPHEGWRAVNFWMFDLPRHGGVFDERVREMVRLTREAGAPYLKMVPQERMTDEAELMRRLDAIVNQGGEGLMLHRKTAFHRKGRSDDLLKLKRFSDAEAVVLEHLPGQGKYAGLLGALRVQTEEGITFRIGSGFSDAERADPPPLGATVTFRHQGFTQKEIPRFPVFMRIRGAE